MTWIWTDHGNLDTAPQLQLEDGKSLHVTAGPEVEMATLLLITAAPELLQSCKELRDACAAMMRVIAAAIPDRADILDCFMDECRDAGVVNGFGVRAQRAVAKAEGMLTR